MCQAGRQLHEVGPEFGLSRCRRRALEPLGAAESKNGFLAHLKKCARVLVERNVLRLSSRFDVVLKYGIDIGNKLAH